MTTVVMTPSEVTPITAGQIGKLQDLLGARLRKSGLSSEPVQQVLEAQGDAVADEMLASIRKRVEAASNRIVRHVRIDRSLKNQQALDATGRRQYTDRKAVDGMPQGEGEETDVFFFKPDTSCYSGGLISEEEVARQYELRGLKPDPRAQAKANEDDPAFADERPNGSQWQRPNGSQWQRPDGGYDFATFGRWGGERFVSVDHFDGDGDDWHVNWWFAGVRK